MLTDSQAVRAGGYYAQSEFDLTHVLAVPGRLVEVGRVCVHPDFCNGIALGLLWSGLARFMLMHRYEYLMGGAGIPLTGDMGQIGAMWQTINAPTSDRLHYGHSRRHPSPHYRWLRPARLSNCHRSSQDTCSLAPRCAGEPAWELAFNVTDLLLLLSLERLSARYAQH